MKLGDIELHVLVPDLWRADGGMMFGVVPKVLWEKRAPADEDNLVAMACNAVVVRLGGKVIVCETGIGTKLSEKRARQARLRQPEGLLEGLARLGIRPAEVDVVLATHLHWDHSGGLTRRADDHLEVTFPRARHFVQRAEWEFAQSPDPRSQPGYLAEDFLPVAEVSGLELLDGDTQILPGLEVRLTGGHTPGHQMIVLRSGELGCVMPGDLVPTRPHLRLPWTMSADLNALRLLDQKARFLDEASRHRWLVILGHEPTTPMGYLGEDGDLVPVEG